MNFVKIENGDFLMGDDCSHGRGEENEFPARQVSINSVWIKSTTVTMAEWRKFIRESDYFWDFWQVAQKYSPTYEHPAVFISWDDATAFCQWHSEKGRVMRLPTEAEWEYICKVILAESKRVTFEFWCEEHSEHHPLANSWKNIPNLEIYGFWHGISEWCADFYDEEIYKTLPGANPCNLVESKYRYWRGGSPLAKGYPRCSFRGFDVRDARTPGLGFRPILEYAHQTHTEAIP